MIDAFLIDLPDIETIFPGTDWGMLWAATLDPQGSMVLSLVDFTPGERFGDGTINRKVTYRIAIPPR